MEGEFATAKMEPRPWAGPAGKTSGPGQVAVMRRPPRARRFFLTRPDRSRQMSGGTPVSHLRLVPRAAPQLTLDEACLDAFQQELAYVYRSFRRLGTAPSEVEDLAQDLFLALRRLLREAGDR